MEYVGLIIVAIIFSLLDDRLSGKKKVPKPQKNKPLPSQAKMPKRRDIKSEPTIKIPPLVGSPQSELEVLVTLGNNQEILRQQEELQAKWKELKKQKRELEVRTAVVNQSATITRKAVNHKRIRLNMLANNLQEAIILSEIVGKPRALKSFSRR